MAQINMDMYNGLLLLGYTGTLAGMYREWEEALGIVTLKDEYDYYVSQGFSYGYRGQREYWDSLTQQEALL